MQAFRKLGGCVGTYRKGAMPMAAPPSATITLKTTGIKFCDVSTKSVDDDAELREERTRQANSRRR